MFNILMGLSDEKAKNLRFNKREAIRGVIFKGNKILMIKNNRGDYKFPGGGVKENESRMEALVREIMEESGYEVLKIDRQIGTVVERRPDMFCKDAVFEMISYYYLCHVSDKRRRQRLDPYEIAQEFTPVWVNIDEAISNNETLLNSGNENINNWVKRETMVLREIKNMINDR